MKARFIPAPAKLALIAALALTAACGGGSGSDKVDEVDKAVRDAKEEMRRNFGSYDDCVRKSEGVVDPTGYCNGIYDR